MHLIADLPFLLMLQLLHRQDYPGAVAATTPMDNNITYRVILYEDYGGNLVYRKHADGKAGTKLT